MSLQDNSTYQFIMKHEKFFHLLEGLCIIILLVGVWIFYFSGQELKKEISENCGWEGEDFQCFCQKDDALALKSRLENTELGVIDFGIPK